MSAAGRGGGRRVRPPPGSASETHKMPCTVYVNAQFYLMAFYINKLNRIGNMHEYHLKTTERYI